MSSEAIWYITFQSPTLSGSGLATYCREVIKAAKSQDRAVRFYYVDPKATQRSESNDGLVSIVTVPGVADPAYSEFGPFMYPSLAIARAVLADLDAGKRPIGIECPDGYALGYHLLQYKRTLHPALESIPITVVAHTPIAIIDEWIGLDKYRSPEWWMYRAEKWCFLACDAVVTYSDMLEETLRAKGYLPGHVPVKRRPNPFSTTVEASEIKQAKDPRSVVVMASQMLNWKGLPHALSLAQQLEMADSSLNVELLGPNPTLPGQNRSQIDLMRAEYPDLFASNRIAYKGSLTHEELVEQRKLWTCQIHPSKYDNFPYSVLECLAQGTPCLMTSGNGVSECLSDDLSAALVVDFEKPNDVVAALESLPTPKALIDGIDWSQFDAPSYFAGRDSLFSDIAAQNQLKKHFPFLHETPQENLNNTTSAEDISASERVSLVSNAADTEFVTPSSSALPQEYLEAAAKIFDQYDNVGFVGCWTCQNDPEFAGGQKVWPCYNAEPLPNIICENGHFDALILRKQVWSVIEKDDPEIAPEFRNWDRLLSVLGKGHRGVILPAPLHEITKNSKPSDAVSWRQHYNQLVQKHSDLFGDNVVELSGFLNANGADAAYRLAVREHSLFKKPQVQGRLKPLHRVARSLAKRLNKFAAKGVR